MKGKVSGEYLENVSEVSRICLKGFLKLSKSRGQLIGVGLDLHFLGPFRTTIFWNPKYFGTLDFWDPNFFYSNIFQDLKFSVVFYGFLRSCMILYGLVWFLWSYLVLYDLLCDC